jgi:hypothetical protein
LTQTRNTAGLKGQKHKNTWGIRRVDVQDKQTKERLKRENNGILRTIPKFQLNAKSKIVAITVLAVPGIR